ncbi:hypothetical protein AMTR_s00047p00175730 [Amborella trichopoda]|uniref:Nucleolar protein 14 n=1 Tax=Amborella trichopoda TaxID=13333 RepID=U5D8R1_AMBTC|nr:hypothetical protein AMTR_s00047p00175730 [Amborella trichopoda]
MSVLYSSFSPYYQNLLLQRHYLYNRSWRKKTLLKEYKQSGKSSIFLDKRIGERDENLGEFDKAILRFQRERQTQLKRKSRYNLSDGEVDDLAIPPTGALSTHDDFEDQISEDGDEDATGEDANISIHQNNERTPLEMSSLPEDENRQKTRKEVMEEIISKSKFYKAEKAQQKEDDENLMDKLNTDFTSLAQSDGFLSLLQPTKMQALKAILNKSSSRELGKEKLSSCAAEVPKEDEVDPYDKLVKSMALDMRARPSDRTKTPEEIAEEERQCLISLEEARKKRMLPTGDSDIEDDSGDEEFDTSSSRKLKSISGDDLGDSFEHEEETPKRGWVDEILEGKEHDESESEDESSVSESESDQDDSDLGNTQSVKDWEQSDDDNLHSDKEGEETPGEEGFQEEKNETHIKIQRLNAEKKNSNLGSGGDLPFVIDAPSSLKELSSLLENRPDDEVIEAIRRIRACNAITLAAENRKKMQIFYGLLLQYFAVLANSKPLNFKKINLLVGPLMEMNSETPYFAAICAQQRLVKMQNQLCDDLKHTGKHSWPSFKTLCLLRLWSMIYPCSDFSHVVMTPACLLMSEYLMRCPVTSSQDIVVGTFLCSMILAVAKQSHKFFPEAITFLRALLMSAADDKEKLKQHSWLEGTCAMELMLQPWLRLSDHVCDLQPLNLFRLIDMPANAPFFSSDGYRAGILVSVTETLRGFINTYEGLISFPEIFSSVSALLHDLIKQEYMPDLVVSSMQEIIQRIEEKSIEHQKLRQPLQMRKQKPVPIKEFNPKFEENFVKGRDYDPDRERAERRKLERQMKRETKGAARELRKDNYFLFEVKAKEKALEEEERAEKYGKAMAFLQEQEHAFKSGQLGKGRKRRRFCV